MTANPKEIIFEEEARDALMKGIEALADVTAITLGPKGRNVGIDSGWGSPSITTDGQSIAKDVELKNTEKNLGVSIGQEVASKIKEKSGDGTTTGIVLLRSLVRTGVKNITSGANPIAIKRGMDKTLEGLLKEIDALSVGVENKEQTGNIASVSASGNLEIGEQIANCFEKVGRSGVIAIEEGKGTQTSIEIVEGMQLDRGYLSSHFCTDLEKMWVEMKNPSILITDQKISSAQEILPVLQAVASSGKELLIIADDIEGDALATLVMNKLRGLLKVAAIKAPGFGSHRKGLLEDIAILTGAELITEEKGLTLRDSNTEILGSASQITVTKDKTTIVGGSHAEKEVEKRVEQLTAEIAATSSNYDREKLEERKAKLQGGVALIKVGAPTEAEMKRKKQMFEDSLSSTRAALEEGIVPGGGVALLKAKTAYKLNPSLTEEEKVGATVLLTACEAPFRQIVENTGFDPSVELEKVLEKQGSFGFNAKTEMVEDLILAGVLDAAKVVKNSLIYAVSAAGMVLLSEALIVNAKEETNA